MDEKVKGEPPQLARCACGRAEEICPGCGKPWCPACCDPCGTGLSNAAPPAVDMAVGMLRTDDTSGLEMVALKSRRPDGEPNG